VPTQAIPLALLSSLYPFGLAALLLLLSATRPRARAAVFFIGAAALLLVVGFLVVFVLRGAGVNKSRSQSTHYGLQLAIGLLFLVGAWVVAHRPPKPTSDQPSRVTKAVGGSGLLAVLFVGMAMYTPSPTYLAALEDVGASHVSSAEAAVWVVIVVALVLITIEIPILLYVLVPDWTVPKLKALDTWLSVNARTLLIGVLAVLGVWEVVAGIVGLV
jgi:hypothetical protein